MPQIASLGITYSHNKLKTPLKNYERNGKKVVSKLMVATPKMTK